MGAAISNTVHDIPPYDQAGNALVPMNNERGMCRLPLYNPYTDRPVSRREYQPVPLGYDTRHGERRPHYNAYYPDYRRDEPQYDPRYEYPEGGHRYPPPPYGHPSGPRDDPPFRDEGFRQTGTIGGKDVDVLIFPEHRWKTASGEYYCNDPGHERRARSKSRRRSRRSKGRRRDDYDDDDDDDRTRRQRQREGGRGRRPARYASPSGGMGGYEDDYDGYEGEDDFEPRPMPSRMGRTRARTGQQKVPRNLRDMHRSVVDLGDRVETLEHMVDPGDPYGGYGPGGHPGGHPGGMPQGPFGPQPRPPPGFAGGFGGGGGHGMQPGFAGLPGPGFPSADPRMCPLDGDGGGGEPSPGYFRRRPGPSGMPMPQDIFPEGRRRPQPDLGDDWAMGVGGGGGGAGGGGGGGRRTPAGNPGGPTVNTPNPPPLPTPASQSQQNTPSRPPRPSPVFSPQRPPHHFFPTSGEDQPPHSGPGADGPPTHQFGGDEDMVNQPQPGHDVWDRRPPPGDDFSGHGPPPPFDQPPRVGPPSPIDEQHGDPPRPVRPGLGGMQPSAEEGPHSPPTEGPGLSEDGRLDGRGATGMD